MVEVAVLGSSVHAALVGGAPAAAARYYDQSRRVEVHDYDGRVHPLRPNLTNRKGPHKHAGLVVRHYWLGDGLYEATNGIRWLRDRSRGGSVGERLNSLHAVADSAIRRLEPQHQARFARMRVVKQIKT